jgi:hypothetical protein
VVDIGQKGEEVTTTGECRIVNCSRNLYSNREALGSDIDWNTDCIFTYFIGCVIKGTTSSSVHVTCQVREQQNGTKDNELITGLVKTS